MGWDCGHSTLYKSGSPRVVAVGALTDAPPSVRATRGYATRSGWPAPPSTLRSLVIGLGLGLGL